KSNPNSNPNPNPNPHESRVKMREESGGRNQGQGSRDSAAQEQAPNHQTIRRPPGKSYSTTNTHTKPKPVCRPPGKSCPNTNTHPKPTPVTIRRIDVVHGPQSVPSSWIMVRCAPHEFVGYAGLCASRV